MSSAASECYAAGGPFIQVLDAFLFESGFALLDDFGCERLGIGQMADRVLDSPAFGRCLDTPLPITEGLEELVKLLLLSYQI